MRRLNPFLLLLFSFCSTKSVSQNTLELRFGIVNSHINYMDDVPLLNHSLLNNLGITKSLGDKFNLGLDYSYYSIFNEILEWERSTEYYTKEHQIKINFGYQFFNLKRWSMDGVFSFMGSLSRIRSRYSSALSTPSYYPEYTKANEIATILSLKNKVKIFKRTSLFLESSLYFINYEHKEQYSDKTLELKTGITKFSPINSAGLLIVI